MYAQVNKSKENKSHPVANESPQMQRKTKPALRFVDNRPETVSQRRHLEIANKVKLDKQRPVLQLNRKKSHMIGRVKDKENTKYILPIHNVANPYNPVDGRSTKKKVNFQDLMMMPGVFGGTYDPDSLEENKKFVNKIYKSDIDLNLEQTTLAKELFEESNDRYRIKNLGDLDLSKTKGVEYDYPNWKGFGKIEDKIHIIDVERGKHPLWTHEFNKEEKRIRKEIEELKLTKKNDPEIKKLESKLASFSEMNDEFVIDKNELFEKFTELSLGYKDMNKVEIMKRAIMTVYLEDSGIQSKVSFYSTLFGEEFGVAFEKSFTNWFKYEETGALAQLLINELGIK